MNPNTPNSDNALNIDVLAQKLLDADSCGFAAECSPDEAEAMGAFTEDALDEIEAMNGASDGAIIG
jgi:hypothetical protein